MADRLLREFHLSEAEYQQVLRFQGGCCAICKRHASEFTNRLAVDHRHSDGLLRGLLCFTCNKRWFRDDPVLYKSASEYLFNPPITQIFGERFTAPGRVGTKARAKRLKAMKKQ